MRVLLLTLSVLALAACAGDGRLMNLTASDDGPEEFAIVPTRPLQMPPDLAQLPAPTPGGANLTDPNPEGDAIAALGGNPGHLAQQGIGAGDGALVAHAARAGVTQGIRQVTAAEDQAIRARRGRRPLEVLAGTNVYHRAYEPQTLDSEAELERWRRTGVQVPTAPPVAETR
ncbi:MULTISPECIES: DUF3035 domain-containing protein [unclassified Paracoccus (in: a-proteobacteria)]|uniref:DUF3035 domain-containing protein n=1 Tax=unclassified Paracoccus (in: a-proteobacteria) TaxID=2688777 RepID=UPI0016030321|nr:MULTISPECIES: DUF3035 domain-containing protein [unclassified Paracoccus (in: a-proteobacteria)]MBB1492107.1 DUF3035 domain-containing protein [Paracoccus sp. MC1854]MBB1497993.1 DUF3035 domain-containing protein [Paracoccus sp. MC1862]QQO44376.1 DUF3035 domain-containing protein [Paracoccus sp. MC1862]